MAKDLNRAGKLGYDIKIIDGVTIKVLEFDVDGNILLATGTTVPTLSGVGFAKGCRFIDTDVSAGTSGTYENIGSTSACNFNLLSTQTQGAQTAKTTSATLTAAEISAGIITVNQGAGAVSALQLPLATSMDTGFPQLDAGDAFDFSLINISTVAAEDASITTNTGWTLVGNMDVASNAAAADKSAGRFRARKTATAAWTLYRLS